MSFWNHYVREELLPGIFAFKTGWNQVDRKAFRASCACHRRPESSYGFL